MKIFLNPGHDRRLDAGAVHPTRGLWECDLAYALGERVKHYLEARRMTVLTEQQHNLQAVCAHANESGAHIFVSLHFNAFNGRAGGTETLVGRSAAAVLLGHAVQARVQQVLQLPDRGIKERPDLYVLRATRMPAILVETCFIDNDADLRRYEGREDACARAVADGICQYGDAAGFRV